MEAQYKASFLIGKFCEAVDEQKNGMDWSSVLISEDYYWCENTPIIMVRNGRTEYPIQESRFLAHCPALIARMRKAGKTAIRLIDTAQATSGQSSLLEAEQNSLVIDDHFTQQNFCHLVNAMFIDEHTFPDDNVLRASDLAIMGHKLEAEYFKVGAQMTVIWILNNRGIKFSDLMYLLDSVYFHMDEKYDPFKEIIYIYAAAKLRKLLERPTFRLVFQNFPLLFQSLVQRMTIEDDLHALVDNPLEHDLNYSFRHGARLVSDEHDCSVKHPTDVYRKPRAQYFSFDEALWKEMFPLDSEMLADESEADDSECFELSERIQFEQSF